MLSWQGSAPIGWGSILIVAAYLSRGIDDTLTRKPSSADPVQTARLEGFVAGTVNLALVVAHGAALPGTATIIAAGVWLRLTERHEHEHAHETMQLEHRHTHEIHHRHDHAPADPSTDPHSHPHRHARSGRS